MPVIRGQVDVNLSVWVVEYGKAEPLNDQELLTGAMNYPVIVVERTL